MIELTKLFASPVSEPNGITVVPLLCVKCGASVHIENLTKRAKGMWATLECCNRHSAALSFQNFDEMGVITFNE
jgi:hypothetical protein